MNAKHLSLECPELLNFHDIKHLVALFAPLLEACRSRHECRVTVGMSRLSFATPGPLAVLTTGIRALTHGGAKVTLSPPSNSGCHAYLTRFDFYSRLGIDVPYEWSRRDASGRFLALAEVVDEEGCHRAAVELAKIVRQQSLSVDADAEKAVFLALVEILDNVFHHARSEVLPIVCAQSYGDGRIEMAIVDLGDGFAESLKRNPTHRLKVHSDTSAVELSIQRGVTANPDGKHAGEGLYFARELVRDNSGAMLVHSGTGRLSIRGARQVATEASMWPGSIVALALRSDRPLNPTRVYNRYAELDADKDLFPEGDDEPLF